MKNLFNLFVSVLMLVFATSCENDIQVEPPPLPDDSAGTIVVRSGGDGKNDLLGYGYNVLYAIGDNYKGAKNQVVDVDRYKSNTAIDPVTGQKVTNLPQGKVEESLLHGSSTQYETYGSNLNEFYEQTATKVDQNTGSLLSWGKLSLSAEYDSNIDSKSMYAFYKADLCRNIKRVYFNTYSPKRLKYYLTDDFLFALKNYTAKEIVDDYGTHVLTDIYVGGKLSILVSAIQKSTATTDVKKFTLDVCSMLTTHNKDSVRTNNAFQDLRFVLVQYGGREVETIKKEIKGDGSIAYDIFDWSKWVNSVDASTSNLIYSEPSTFVPIWEFIDDPTLKQQVIDEINRRGQKVDPPTPIEPKTYHIQYMNQDWFYKTGVTAVTTKKGETSALITCSVTHQASTLVESWCNYITANQGCEIVAIKSKVIKAVTEYTLYEFEYTIRVYDNAVITARLSNFYDARNYPVKIEGNF